MKLIEERGRTLADRQTVAVLLERSVHTVRLRCPVVEYCGGVAMYDLEQCEEILGHVEKRRRK